MQCNDIHVDKDAVRPFAVSLYVVQNILSHVWKCASHQYRYRILRIEMCKTYKWVCYEGTLLTTLLLIVLGGLEVFLFCKQGTCVCISIFIKEVSGSSAFAGSSSSLLASKLRA